MNIMPKKSAGMIFCVLLSHCLSAEIVGPYLLSDDKVPATLSTNGQIYALSGDVTGDITITANDVTLNLNERLVTGRIIISGQRAVIYGGKVIAPAPTSNATADAGVIQINSSANNAQITDVYVSAADTATAGVRGARGMHIDADNVTLKNIFVHAGNNGVINGVVDGGIGIQTSGNALLVDSSQIYGGNGSSSTSTVISTGNGGIGINITAGTDIQIISIQCAGGTGGQATVGTRGGTLGSGGTGMVIAANVEIIIENSMIIGGDASTSVGTAIATQGNTVGGNGGRGVHSAAADLVVQSCELRGGTAGVVTATGLSGIGTATFSFTGGAGGGGLYLDTNSRKSVVHNCTLYGGDSVALSSTGSGTTRNVNPVGNLSRGGHGIEVVQQIVNGVNPSALLQSCDVQGGRGLNIVGASTITSVQGNEAGHGVALSATNTAFVDILDCVITTYKGGNIQGAAFGTGNSGGNGGDGIHLGTSAGDGTGINGIYILRNTFSAIGGGGTASGTGSVGGDGGYGIFIGTNLTSVEIGNNVIAYSPGGGTAASSGANRQAIFEDATASAVIYSNVAYEIAASPEYVLNATDAVDDPNGTAFLLGGLNNMENIYK